MTGFVFHPSPPAFQSIRVGASAKVASQLPPTLPSWELLLSSGGWIRTSDLQVMSLASYHCSTPGSISFGFGFTAAVSFENPRRSKFSQFMPYHVFGHVKADKVFAVVNEESRADEFGNDSTITRPCFDRFPAAGTLVAFDFSQQTFVNVRPFFERPTHPSLQQGWKIIGRFLVMSSISFLTRCIMRSWPTPTDDSGVGR